MNQQESRHRPRVELGADGEKQAADMERASSRQEEGSRQIGESKQKTGGGQAIDRRKTDSRQGR